jgi:pyridoxal phosphate enzyme (YggS family)
MMTIADNLDSVRERIARAAARSGRDPSSIGLVAVTKGQGPAVVRSLWQLGQRDFGENRVQEALSKFQLPLPDARWHMIGPLQANKINKLIPHVALVHSLDSLEIAVALSQRAARQARRIPVLLEVKTSTEPAKHGVDPAVAVELYARLLDLPGLLPRGLMTIAPMAGPEVVRESFRTLRQHFDALHTLVPPPDVLSMGMSDDFELAVEEGATLVRIGRALFAS